MAAFSKLLTLHFQNSLHLRLYTEVVCGLGPLGLNRKNYPFVSFCYVRGTVPLWLVCSTPEQAAPSSSAGRGHCAVFLGK